MQGVQGLPGFNGSDGSDGDSGRMGLQGLPGINGTRGPPGSGNFSQCQYKASTLHSHKQDKATSVSTNLVQPDVSAIAFLLNNPVSNCSSLSRKLFYDIE